MKYYIHEHGHAVKVPDNIEVKVIEEVVIPATKDVYQLKSFQMSERVYTALIENGVERYYKANGDSAIHILLRLMFFKEDHWSERKNIVEADWFVSGTSTKNPRHMPAGCYVDTGFGFYGQFLIPHLCELDRGYKRTSVKLEDLTEKKIGLWKEKLAAECSGSAE